MASTATAPVSAQLSITRRAHGAQVRPDSLPWLRLIDLFPSNRALTLASPTFAVFSCGLSGLVALLLSLHWVVQRNKDWRDSIKVRIDGRHFMLSVTAFVLVIALMALVFSKIEGWTYVTGIFFCIVSTLTVGFGAFNLWCSRLSCAC